MRIAFILQCHKNPIQVNRLIDKLRLLDCDVYIHIDRKSDFIDEIAKYNNIFIVSNKERVDIKWGGITQCLATITLLKKVVLSKKKYDYVWLISGQDYPVKSASYISDYLTKNKGKCFIDIIPQENKDYANFDKRNDLYHFDFMVSRRLLSRIIKKMYYFLTGGSGKTFKLFKRKALFNKNYHGSSWWCIPFDYAKKIYYMVDTDKRILEYFSHSINSDESMFQTLIMQVAKEEEISSNLLYVDWSTLASSPKILTKNDSEQIFSLGDDILIARKFDIDTDSEIFDMIDNEISKY